MARLGLVRRVEARHVVTGNGTVWLGRVGTGVAGTGALMLGRVWWGSVSRGFGSAWKGFVMNPSETSDLFRLPRVPASTAFSGETYSAPRDFKRLNGQLRAVADLMADGQWRTLWQITLAAGGSEAGASARLRDLRKPQYGEHTVERRHIDNGVWEYRLIVNRGKA